MMHAWLSVTQERVITYFADDLHARGTFILSLH